MRAGKRILAVAVMLAGTALSSCGYIDAAYDYATPAFRTVLLAQPLSESALQQMYMDETHLAIRWVDGSSGELALEPGGRARLTANGRTYDGTWQIREQALCTRFGDKRETRCFHQYSDGELYDARTGSRHGVISRL